jgi:hypothetical protein
MKISLWTQFASNHSNSFTVVGSFPSEQSAVQAAAELREIFGHIINQSIRYDDTKPVKAEVYYAEEFDIKWDEHLDWVNEKGVVLLDQHLIVGSIYDTHQGAYVIDELIAKLGATTVIKQEEMGRETTIFVRVEAVAPDEINAKRLYEEINTFYPDEEVEEELKRQIVSNDSQIIIKNLYFGDHLGLELPRLIKWLRAQGCTVKYRFSNKREK